MPGTDFTLDPITHDLVDDGEGDWEETTSLAPQAHHQLLDDLGAWWADQSAGCAAWTVPRKADRANVLKREDAYRDALQVFVELGLAESVVIETESDQLNRVAWEGSLVDLQYGRLDITPLLSFGVGQGT